LTALDANNITIKTDLNLGTYFWGKIDLKV